MRNPDRIDITLEALRKLWNQHPDQRLGQILENYVFYDGKRGDLTSVSLFYQEDDITLANIKKGIDPNTLDNKAKIIRDSIIE